MQTAPRFIAAGSVSNAANNVSNPTNLTPGAPAGKADGDLLICITFCREEASATVSTPSGWNLVSGFPVSSATDKGGRIYAFTRRADGSASDTPTVSWSGVVTGTSGDSSTAVILAYEPWLTETLDGTVPSPTDTTATNGTVSLPTYTTTFENSLIVGCLMKVQDASQTWTPSTYTERVDASTTSGTGHCMTVVELIKSPAGSQSTGGSAPSSVTSGRVLAVNFALRVDAPRYGFTHYQDPGVF